MKKIILILFSISIISVLILLTFIVVKGNILKPPNSFDSIIILGCQVKEDGSLSKQLHLRLSKALDIYNKNPQLIVASGGQGVNEPISEGLAMKKWLIENGVKEEHVIAETNSYSTYENIEKSMEILKSKNLSKPIIITSDYHIPRAMAIAKDYGLEPQGISSPTEPKFWVKNYGREVLAWGKYFLKKVVDK
ncbi:MAG: YdcF family protein [Christensenellaceae bacterium]|nr:YdcF family protein [Christensenellaceae bacterium]